MARAAHDKVLQMIEKLLGTWKLVATERVEVASGAKTEQFGPSPQGFINYAPDGRMMALIARSDRKAPAGQKATDTEAEALFRSMLAYAGTYSVDGNEVTHHVDLSWNESFTGGKQVRIANFEGNLLKLSTPQSLDPIDGKMSVRVMTWQKVT
jgi:Lipocalin-like domain